MSTAWRIHRVGERGLMVDLPDIEHVHGLVGWARQRSWASDLEELVPGGVTVYLQARPTALGRIARDLRRADWDVATSSPHERVHHTLPVRYDGPDLEQVARAAGLDRDEVVALHTGARYTVDFFGFSPGQAFFSGVATPLQLPRRRVPRTRVPAGSVAIANAYTVIYPRFSPGGWNLVGTYVGDPLWRDHVDPPTVVGIGDTVSFADCDA